MGDFVVVLEVGDVVMGSTGLGATLVDDVIVVATVMLFTDMGVGAEVTCLLHQALHNNQTLFQIAWHNQCSPHM